MALRSSTDVGARALGLAVLLGLGLALAPSRARADDAEALITRGIELREQGKDEQALELFRRALAQSPTPRARAQVALAEQALGMWIAAERDLVLAIGADDPWIKKHRGPLEAALGVVQSHLGELDVRGGPPGAEVFIDGARVGSLPLASPARVVTGAHTVEVRAPGYVAVTRSTSVAAGGVARETVDLARAAPASSASAGAPAATGAPPGGEGPAPAPGAGDTQRLLGYGALGLGAASLGLGVAGLLVRQGIVSDYNAQCPGVGKAQPPECADKISSGDTWRTVSIVALVSAGVLGGGGAVLLLTAPKKAAKLDLACGLGVAGAACAGTF